MVKFSTTNCPCRKESLCEPLTVKYKQEVFGFSINGKKNINKCDWDKLTAIVVFGDSSHDLLCKAHEKVCEFFFSNAKNCKDLTAQKMKFYIKDFFGNCDQIRSFLHGKLYFLCSVCMELLMEKVFFVFARKARLQMFNSHYYYY